MSGVRPASDARPILLRHVLFGRTWCALPVWRLEQSRDEVIVAIACDTEWLAAHDGANRRLRIGAHPSWRLGPVRWTGQHLLYAIPFGSWVAYGALVDPATGSVKQFYLNFQRPLVASPEGFDTLDLELDLVVEPRRDGSHAWRFKDARRFAWLASRGVLRARDVLGVMSTLPSIWRGYTRYGARLRRWARVPLPGLDINLDAVVVPGSVHP